MNYIVTESHKKNLKVGVIWNTIVVMFTAFILLIARHEMSASEFWQYMLTLAVITFPILAVNIYAYKKVVKYPRESVVRLGFAFAIISLFFLGQIGSIITIVAYARIRKFNNNLAGSIQQPIREIIEEQINKDPLDFRGL